MLEIANLSHTYANGTVALDDVSLSIPRGMFGLLGPNGAGKSTLMRTIATLQEPTSGTITFGEIDVLRQPEELRKTLGYFDPTQSDLNAQLFPVGWAQDSLYRTRVRVRAKQ